MPARPAKHREGTYTWLLEALVKTLSGTLLGVVTAALLLIAIHLFVPSLIDFDVDFGLRFTQWINETLRFRSAGMPVAPGDRAFILLDVDPELAAGAVGADACGAFLGQPDAHPPEAALVHCERARPLNRYLLAALLRGVRARQAALVVLDIDLSAGSDLIKPEENQSLLQALLDTSPGLAPVIAVQSADYLPADGDEVPRVLALPSTVFDAVPRRLTGTFLPSVSAIALPVPGQPLRRYPKCYRTSSDPEEFVASVPYLAAQYLDAPTGTPGALCLPGPVEASSGEPRRNAPRIQFRFPTMLAHEDDTLNGADFRRWSVYRRVYDRCLAANFWNDKSACGDAQFYQGKVVVIGATNRLRLDRHYTPIGNMAGAEVVINAIQSFRSNDESDDTLITAILHKLRIVSACVPLWLVFFCVREYLYRPTPRPRALGWRLGRAILAFLAFWCALFLVCVVSVKMALASFSVCVAVLAIAMEQYVEVVTRWITHPIEGLLKRWLHLPDPDHGH